MYVWFTYLCSVCSLFFCLHHYQVTVQPGCCQPLSWWACTDCNLCEPAAERCTVSVRKELLERGGCNNAVSSGSHIPVKGVWPRPANRGKYTQCSLKPSGTTQVRVHARTNMQRGRHQLGSGRCAPSHPTAFTVLRAQSTNWVTSPQGGKVNVLSWPFWNLVFHP